MHRTEGTHNSAGQFTDGPPGTTIESRWLYAVQEEILYVIEQAGLTPNPAAADSSDQLKRAIELMLTANVAYARATTNYGFTDTDGIELLLVNSFGGAVTVTLPTAADNAGRHIVVKVSTSGNNVTVAGEGAELIDRFNTYVMIDQYDCLDVTCTGTKWTINNEFQKGVTAYAITAAYGITDVDNVELILADPSARAFTVTLPTAVDNAGRHIVVKVTAAGGAVTVAGEGAELIDAANTFVMQSIYDFLDITCNGTKWHINGAKQSLDTGWIQRDAWTNEHLGSATVAYNAGAGAFVVGELITESVSNNTGIIMADTGAVLTLKNVTGTGVFTNVRTLTGSTSGCARTVNGSTVGVDTNVTHNFGISLPSLTKVNTYVSSDKSEATIIRHSSYNYSNDGINHWGVDTNNILLQTGSTSYGYLAANGAGTACSANWYYKVIVEVIK